MAWQALGSYRDCMLWVREVGLEGWVVAVISRRLPGSLAPGAPPPEEMVSPPAFDSEAEAIEATKRFLDWEAQRCNHQSAPDQAGRAIGGRDNPGGRQGPANL